MGRPLATAEPRGQRRLYEVAERRALERLRAGDGEDHLARAAGRGRLDLAENPGGASVTRVSARTRTAIGVRS